jgi:hypothetical protein
MIRTDGRFVSYGELWFDEEPPQPQPGILVFRQRLAPEKNVGAKEFLSLVNDLQLPQERLWQAFDKSTRYDIRRAQNRDLLTCTLHPAPTQEQIGEFARFFDAFATNKRLERTSLAWLSAAANAGHLCLSAVRDESRALVWHSYVTCGTFARLYQSASYTSDRSSASSQLVGRANRLLHWNDMIELKRLGFARYDWGGISPAAQSLARQNINRFKKEFGGREHVYYNWVSAVSLLGRLYMPFRYLWVTRRAGLPDSPRYATLGERDLSDRG